MSNSIPEGTLVPAAEPLYSHEIYVTLEGHEGVRKRPVMYLGEIQDGSGPLALVRKVIDEAIDHHSHGCRRVGITLHTDGSVTIERDGQAMPTRKVFEGKSGAELELTRNACCRRARDWDAGLTSERVSDMELMRPFGLELLIANALSERLDLEIGSRGVLHRQTYVRGVPEGPLAAAGSHQGEDRQRIRFWPDPTILRAAGVDLARLHERLSDLTLLYPAMSFDLRVEQRSYAAPRGLQEGVERILPMVSSIGPVLAGAETFGKVQVELAMRWVEYGGLIRSFVNHEETKAGGSHVDGLLQAIRGAIRQEHERAGHPLPRHKKMDPTPGLIAFVQVRMEDPSWDGGSRARLGSSEARPALRLLAERLIAAALAASPELRAQFAG